MRRVPTISAALLSAAVLALSIGIASPASATPNYVVVPGGGFPWASAISPDGSTIAEVGIGNIYLFDTATKTFTANYAIGANLLDAVFDPTGSTLYVVDGAPNNSIHIVDVATGVESANSPIALPSTPETIARDASTGLLYVSGDAAGGLVIVDPSTSPATISSVAIAAPGSFDDLALSADGGTVYIAHNGTTSVEVVDVAASPPTVGTPLTAGLNPLAVAIDTGHPNWILSADYTDHTVSFMDATGVAAASHVDVGATANPIELTSTPDGNTVLSVSLNSNTLDLIDFATRAVCDSLTFPGQPMSVNVSSDGKTAYVPVLNNGMAVVDLTTTACTASTGGTTTAGATASNGLAATGVVPFPAAAGAAALLLLGSATFLTTRRARRRLPESQR